MCDRSCASCSSESPFACLSCFPDDLHFADGHCGLCLDTNEYFNATLQECKPCHSSCLTCSGPSKTQCLTCPPSKHLFVQASKQSCVTCNTTDGQFVSGIYCINCHSKCRTCTSQAATDCLTCYAGNHLMNDQTCGVCDLTKQFVQDDLYCLDCDSNCQSCLETAKNCQTCPLGMLMYGD